MSYQTAQAEAIIVLSNLLFVATLCAQFVLELLLCCNYCAVRKLPRRFWISATACLMDSMLVHRHLCRHLPLPHVHRQGNTDKLLNPF